MSQGAFDDLFAGIGAPAAATGWYGKLASLGDFAHRRLPQPFVDAMDTWLAAGMEASRQQLGPQWLDVYLTGPVWRFALAPGVLDGQWWFGVMMPSVDKVGRYFPLLAARPATIAPESAAAVEALAAWYAHVSAAVLDTLQPQSSVESFEAALASAPPWVDEVPARRPSLERLAGRDRYRFDGDAALPQWVAGIGLREALQLCGGKSLWWPDHAHTPDTSLSLSPGLPDAGSFALLLEGRW